MRKKGKIELYNQRLEDKKHHQRMFVDPDYFKKSGADGKPRQQEIDVCRNFNSVGEEFTKTNEYSVLLNRGIPEMAADLFYQYKRLNKWAEGKGCIEDVHSELFEYGVDELYRSIRQGVNQGAIAIESDRLLKMLSEVNGGTLKVLLYMKARCSRPTSTGGVTDLMAETIAKNLGFHRNSVGNAWKELENKGLIEKIIKNKVPVDGKIKTYTRYLINI